MSGTYLLLPAYGDPHWQGPVASFAALPATSNLGDIHLASDTGSAYWWTGSAWSLIGASAGGVVYWSTPVANFAALPAGTVAGETRVTLDNFKIYTWNGASWQLRVLRVADLTSTTDGSSAGAGVLNEVLSATTAANTSTGVGGSGTYGSVISKAITAGRWQIQGVAGLSENGATLTTSLTCGISTSSTGVGISDFATTVMPWLLSSTSDAVASTPVIYVTLSGTVTYHLNTRFFYTSGTPQHRGEIRACRIG